MGKKKTIGCNCVFKCWAPIIVWICGLIAWGQKSFCQSQQSVTKHTYLSGFCTVQGWWKIYVKYISIDIYKQRPRVYAHEKDNALQIRKFLIPCILFIIFCYRGLSFFNLLVKLHLMFVLQSIQCLRFLHPSHYYYYTFLIHAYSLGIYVGLFEQVSRNLNQFSTYHFKQQNIAKSS